MNVTKCEVVHTSTPIRSPQYRATLFLVSLAGGGAMRGEIINEYKKLNSEEQKTFHRWLWANAVVGAILLTGLIALASMPRNESEATAQNAARHAHTKLLPERPEGENGRAYHRVR